MALELGMSLVRSYVIDRFPEDCVNPLGSVPALIVGVGKAYTLQGFYFPPCPNLLLINRQNDCVLV